MGDEVETSLKTISVIFCYGPRTKGAITSLEVFLDKVVGKSRDFKVKNIPLINIFSYKNGLLNFLKNLLI